MRDNNAYERHPVEDIEPIPDEGKTQRAEILSAFLQMVYSSENPSNKLYVTRAVRRFICLTNLIRPDLLRGMSQIEIGEILNCTSSNVSYISHTISKETGIQGGLQGEESSCNRRRAHDKGGQAWIGHEKAMAKACQRAKVKLSHAQGGALTKFESSSMIALGFMKLDKNLTESGLSFISI